MTGRRKIIMIFVLIAALFPAVYVFAETGEYRFSPESRHDTSYMNYLFETEQAVYMYDGANCLMMYLDESDMTWYPLCNKPECLHTVDILNMESDCNAFVGNGHEFVYWKGRTYYVELFGMDSPGRLSSMNTDGTQHRVERQFAYSDFQDGDQYVGTTPVLHRGKAYLILNYMGEEPYKIVTYDLDHTDRNPEIIWEDEAYIVPFFRGDSLIYGIVDEKTERQDMYRMNPDGTEQMLILNDAHFDVSADEDFLYRYADGRLTVYSFDHGKETILWENDGQYDDTFTVSSFDGQYFYLRSPDNGILLILDTDGTVMEELKMPDNTASIWKLEDELAYAVDQEEQWRLEKALQLTGLMANHVTGVTRDYIFTSDQYMATHYIERSEIGSGTCEWKPVRMYTDIN